MDVAERFEPGSMEPGTDGWTGEVMVKRTAEGRPMFEPVMPKSAGRLSGEGRSLMAELQATVYEIRERQDRVEGLVGMMREAGVSWALIGWCLGVTGDGARRRWGGEAE